MDKIDISNKIGDIEENIKLIVEAFESDNNCTVSFVTILPKSKYSRSRVRVSIERKHEEKSQ